MPFPIAVAPAYALPNPHQAGASSRIRKGRASGSRELGLVMSNSGTLRSQTLWSMLPILLTSVISIVSVPLYFRVLGDQMYALWFYVMTFTGAFGFMDLGMGVAVARYMGVALGTNDTAAVREYWATGHVIVLPLVAMFTVVFMVLGAGFGPQWFGVEGEGADVLRWAMLAGGLGLFFSYYGQMWFILSSTYLDFKFASLVRTTLALANTIGSILVALLTQNVAWIVAWGTSMAFFQMATLIYRANEKYKLPVEWHRFRVARLTEMLPYTLKTFGQLLSGSVLGSLDRLMLGRYAPPADFAAYNVGLTFGYRIQGLSVAAMGPVFSNTARGVGGDASRQAGGIYRDGFDMMFNWYGLVIAWVAVWQAPLLTLWLGPSTGANVSQSFGWVVAGCCLTALSNISGAQLGPLNRMGFGLVLSIISNLASALLVTGGWLLAGLPGAGAGYCISRMLLLAQDVFVRKVSGISYGTEDLRVLIRILLCAAFFMTAQLVARLVGASLEVVAAIAFVTGFITAIPLLWEIRGPRMRAVPL